MHAFADKIQEDGTVELSEPFGSGSGCCIEAVPLIIHRSSTHTRLDDTVYLYIFISI